MRNERTRRVVITGLGAITPNGRNSESFWQATRDGVSGISRLEQEESSIHEAAIQVAGRVRDFSASEYLDRKLVQRTDRMTHFALAASAEALSDAGLDMAQEEPRRVGAVIANTMGGVNYVLKQLEAVYTRGPRAMSAYTAIAWLHVANVGQAAIHYGFQGYCKTPVNDTVGGLDALGTAYRAIRRGAADVIIAGGSEALLHPFILSVFARQGQYVIGDHTDGYRPFDRRAAGLILAEGAGICILEDYEHARQRSAPIYGEIVGYGQTNDAHGLTTPSADGTRYARAMQLAMQEGQIETAELAYISLDGRAIPSADRGEAHALCLTFGAEAVTIPASVPRTTIGHSYAAAGALDAITALLALKYRLIPPTINNCEDLDPRYELDLVRHTARALPSSPTKRAVLLGGRGVGGANVVLALKQVV